MGEIVITADLRRQRVLQIAGSHNLRDCGGYETADGRMVKWGQLYRSGTMHEITEAGRAELGELGIAVICDLRDSDEREHRPTTWHSDFAVEYWARDYSLSIGNLHSATERAAPAPGAMLGLIQEAYRTLPYEQADAYREIFLRLSKGQVPMLFNCSAGKDRTGIVAALILSVLGVPKAAIAHDYALTDHALDKLVEIFLTNPKYPSFGDGSREIYLPMLVADPAYLDIAFDEMTRRHGSISGYLNEVLGIGEDALAAIRDVLLEA